MTDNPLDLAFDDEPVNDLLVIAGDALEDAVTALTAAAKGQVESVRVRRRLAAYAVTVQDMSHQVKRVANARRTDGD